MCACVLQLSWPGDLSTMSVQTAGLVRQRSWTYAYGQRYSFFMADMTGKRWHDMGGQEAGPVPMEGHDFAIWEKRVDALMVLLSGKGFFTVDGLRRALEDMGEDAFETMTYYERWMNSVTQNLIEAGAYSIEELGQRMEEVAARGDTNGEAQDG